MKSQYRAYLLRLQRGQSESHWRVTMEDAHTGELLRFTNERDMLRYLMQVLSTDSLKVDGQPETNDC